MILRKISGQIMKWSRAGSEADYFREQSLLVIATLTSFSALLWVGQCVSARRISAGSGLMLVFFLFLSFWLMVTIYRRYFLWAASVYLTTHWIFILSMVWLLGDLTIGFVFLLSVSLAGSLIGFAGAIILAGLAGFSLWILVFLSAGINNGAILPWLVLIILLTAVISGQAAQGLYTALEAARLAFQDARRHAEEARRHRGELHKTLRSLDTAYAKLQQVNEEVFEAREAAARALRFKTEFTAQISHELRTPLNLILGFSETMAFAQDSYGARLPSPYLRDVTEIYRNSRHLLTLIDDVLDLSKLDAGRMGLRFEPVILDEVMREVMETIRPLAHAKGLELRVDIPKPLPPLWLDRGRIYQVLLNLVSNATRVTREGGITLKAFWTEQELSVQVKDTGPGIPAAELNGIFEDFHQVGEAAGTSGLGLAVSRRIVELHGGRIWAESESGRGSTFVFSLPLKKSIVLPLLEANPLSPVKQTQPTIVILGEKDTDGTRLLQRHLEGYNLVVAGGWKEAGDLVTRFNARAIIIHEQDIPEAEKAVESVPIITCVLPSPGQTARSMGVAAFIRKPITLGAIQSILKACAASAQRVLIVADDPSAGRLLERMVSTIDPAPQVQRAYSEKEAAGKLAETPPDVILLDWNRSEEGNFRLIERLQADPVARRIPVVVLSDQSMEETSIGRRVGVFSPQGLTPTEMLKYLHAILSAVPPAKVERRTNTPPSPKD